MCDVQATPYAVNYSVEEISNIEEKIKNNESVTDDEVEKLLNYICYKVREKLSDNMYKDTFKGRDLEASSIICNYLNDLGINAKVLNTKTTIDYFATNNNFVIAGIKANMYGVEDVLYYLIDPTFKQFCLFEKGDANRYRERNGIIYEKPSIGHYINPEDAEFVCDFLYYGYMYLDADAASVYGNAFYDSRVPEKKSDTKSYAIPGMVYYNKFISQEPSPMYSKKELEDKDLLIEPIKHKSMQLKKDVTTC